jgi:hypothetical protein
MDRQQIDKDIVQPVIPNPILIAVAADGILNYLEV